MYGAGRTAQVAKDIRNYDVSLLGLSETRWLSTGQLRLASREKLLYSVHTEEGAPHMGGVALMLTPQAQQAIIRREPVSSHIIRASFTTKKKKVKLNVIQCYAPTNNAEDEKKNDFHHQLQDVLGRTGALDIEVLWATSTPR